MKFVLIGVCDYIISFFIGTAASDFPVVSLAAARVAWWWCSQFKCLHVFTATKPFPRAGVVVRDGWWTRVGRVWM